MSHFAEINDNGIVQRVIVADRNFILSGAVGDITKWFQTSYNNNFRKQCAGIGFTYDYDKYIFIAPQPYHSLTLDDNDDWQPPVSMPEDADKKYYWDEDNTTWTEITE